jgi:hypothetical protein
MGGGHRVRPAALGRARALLAGWILAGRGQSLRRTETTLPMIFALSPGIGA